MVDSGNFKQDFESAGTVGALAQDAGTRLSQRNNLTELFQRYHPDASDEEVGAIASADQATVDTLTGQLNAAAQGRLEQHLEDSRDSIIGNADKTFLKEQAPYLFMGDKDKEIAESAKQYFLLQNAMDVLENGPSETNGGEGTLKKAASYVARDYVQTRIAASEAQMEKEGLGKKARESELALLSTLYSMTQRAYVENEETLGKDLETLYKKAEKEFESRVGGSSKVVEGARERLGANIEALVKKGEKGKALSQLYAISQGNN